MSEFRFRWLWSAIALVGVAQPVSAAMVQYVLDQSNAETVLPDGVPRVSVTINDPTNNSGNIVFTVATLPGAFDEGSNFGLQSFGFNLSTGANALSASNFILPTGWSVRASRGQDGFGRFDWVLTRNSGSRLDPLTFQIKNVADTVSSYFDLSTGSASQGHVAFAAHVAGFHSGNDDDEEDHHSEITSAYIGGGTPVPVPAAAWLLGSGLLGLLGFARRRTAG